MRREQAHYLAWALLKLGGLVWVVLLVIGVLATKQDGNPNQREYGLMVHDDCAVHYMKTTTGPRINWVRCGQSPQDLKEITHKTCGSNCTAYINPAS